MTTTLEELRRTDFYAWTKDQAEALRRMAADRWNGPLDLEALADEIEDVGCERCFQVESHLSKIIQYLLLLEFSNEATARRMWIVEVLEARYEIEPRLTATMRAEIEPRLDSMFREARRTAALRLEDKNEPDAARELPAARPYSIDQLINEDWFPENRHGHRERLP